MNLRAITGELWKNVRFAQLLTVLNEVECAIGRRRAQDDVPGQEAASSGGVSTRGTGSVADAGVRRRSPFNHTGNLGGR